MRTIFLIILNFFLVASGFSQTNNDFTKLLSLFKKGYHTAIPVSLDKKYFNYVPDSNLSYVNRTLWVDTIVFQNKKFTGLEVYYDWGAGGIDERNSLFVFTKEGKQISNYFRFEYDATDCGFEDLQYCSYASDSLFILVKQNTTSDCEEDSILTKKVKIHYVYLDKNGKFRPGPTYSIDTRPKYYYLSTDIQEDTAFAGKTKKVLSIMRNEIFAMHGYKFKTQKWIKYFKSKDWYHPKNDNANIKLNLIEKKNIALILKYEKK